MALYPNKLNGQDKLSPGSRGETFQASLPGYRNGADRVNRSNNRLNMNEHDVLNIKYEFDRRLEVLFTYGFAQGFNQMVIPKGRIVAVDPYMDRIDFDTRKQFNTLTVANGGIPVRKRTASDKYQAFTGKVTDIVSPESQGQELNGPKEWTPLMSGSYVAQTLRGFAGEAGEGGAANAVKIPSVILKDAGYVINSATGKVQHEASKTDVENVRPGNLPIGILSRNEYTRDDDAFNGMMPGAIATDPMVELAWFAYKDKAEQNPWGSAYGALFPGCYVKSDENGRFIPSPLSFPELLATMSITEYELERQQIVGQVYAVNHELVPEGAARWSQWALEDRLNFELFNPDTYRQNNRNNEDTVNTSPYNSTGQYPGYGFDKNFLNHDLHMLATSRDYDRRMNQEYQYGLGIPGLTDGYNAVVNHHTDDKAGTMYKAAQDKEYVDFFFRTLEVAVEPGTLEIALGAGAYQPCTVGSSLGTDWLKVEYANELQGIVVLKVTDKAKADAALANPMDVKFKYDKRGLAGVPTFLDWDGIKGSVKILLQK